MPGPCHTLVTEDDGGFVLLRKAHIIVPAVLKWNLRTMESRGNAVGTGDLAVDFEMNFSNIQSQYVHA